MGGIEYDNSGMTVQTGSRTRNGDNVIFKSIFGSIKKWSTILAMTRSEVVEYDILP